jgi:hypothetical protein
MLPFAHTKSNLALRISVCWLTWNSSLWYILNIPLHFRKYKYYISNAVTEIGHGTFNNFRLLLPWINWALSCYTQNELSLDPISWGPLFQGLPRLPVTDEKDFHMWTNGARGSVVGWGTMLQARRSRVLFAMGSLDFSIYLILPAVLWSWGRFSL